MSNQEDESKTTSRRTFAKTLTAAIMAVPALTSFVGAHELAVSAQKGKRAVAPILGTEEARNEHNTPPPIIIGEGSLILERSGEYAPGDVVTQGTRKLHKMSPDGNNRKLFPAHIKIVDGSGEILYRNDLATECMVTLTLVDPDNMANTAIVNAGATPIVNNRRSFVIDTDDNKLLHKTNERPSSTKRDVRYRHKDNGNKEFSIVGVKITEGMETLYRLTLNSLVSKGDELRVMIWLEQSA